MAVPWKRDYIKYQKQFLGILVIYQQNSDVRAFMEVILSIFTVSMFFIFAIKPSATTIATLIKENQQKEQTLATLSQKVEDLKTATDVFDKEKENINLLEAAIPDNSEPNTYLSQFIGLGSRDSVNLSTVSFGPVNLEGKTDQPKSELEGEANSFAVFVDADGSYSQLNQYLQDIQSMRRPFLIHSLSFGLQEQTLTLSIIGEAPYAK